MKIVIIDDEPIICNGLKTIISQVQDPELVVMKTFSDPEEALELCDWNSTDLLIADISMPGMTGFELISILKERGYFFWVIIISAYTDFEYARQAIKDDAIDYIVKPIVPDMVFAALEKAKQKHNDKKKIESSSAFIDSHFDLISYRFFEDLVFETGHNLIDQNVVLLLRLDNKQFTLLEVLYSDDFPTKNDCNQLEKIKTYFFPIGKALYSVLAVSDRSFPSIQSEILKIIPVTSFISDMATTTKISELPSIQKTLMEAFAVKIRKLNVSRMPNDSNYIKISELSTEKQNYSIQVQKAMDIVDKAYSVPLSLTIISDKIHVHPTYLSNLFSKQTGISLIDYINRIRVIKAQSILQDPESRICLVAKQVGFSDQRYFGQVFKKMTGLTPLQYKTTYYMSNSEI